MISPITIWLLTSLLFLFGIAGIFIPAVPGVVLVFAGTLLYAIATGFDTLGATPLMIFGLLALIASFSDYVGGAVGARLGGGGAGTLLGLVVGSLIGLLGGPPGFVIGGLVGATAGAFSEGKTAAQVKRAVLFSVVGVVGAKLLQLLLALAIIVAFLVIIL